MSACRGVHVHDVLTSVKCVQSLTLGLELHSDSATDKFCNLTYIYPCYSLILCQYFGNLKSLQSTLTMFMMLNPGNVPK